MPTIPQATEIDDALFEPIYELLQDVGRPAVVHVPDNDDTIGWDPNTFTVINGTATEKEVNITPPFPYRGGFAANPDEIVVGNSLCYFHSKEAPDWIPRAGYLVEVFWGDEIPVVNHTRDCWRVVGAARIASGAKTVLWEMALEKVGEPSEEALS
jgi:hypothetical protein